VVRYVGADALTDLLSGAGGGGLSSLKATGTVYNLRALQQFPGRHVAARTGAVIGKASFGNVWLKNQNGVFMELRARRTGLTLSTGVDGIVITMK